MKTRKVILKLPLNLKIKLEGKKKAVEGSRKISKAFYLPRGTVKSIETKWGIMPQIRYEQEHAILPNLVQRQLSKRTLAIPLKGLQSSLTETCADISSIISS